MAPDTLKISIRKAFADVRYPAHCGINAACARDTWISDRRVLKRLTRKTDYRGPWWNVPEEHLTNSLGFSYLDPKGVEFYLPALMTLAIDKSSYGVLKILAWELNPESFEDEDDVDLYGYFTWRLSKIEGEKRRVCREFLHHLHEAIAPFGLEEALSVERALNHHYWR
ncbi:DUF6714 family protein [Pseudomonas sp.]|uniref:DUF6714 family protein n=1 Tax=Pseudomonas sp. TaxID=306 RepID=UPI003D0E570F